MTGKEKPAIIVEPVEHPFRWAPEPEPAPPERSPHEQQPGEPIRTGDGRVMTTVLEQPRRRRHRAATPAEFADRQAVRRRAGALEALADAIDESATLVVPPPVQEIKSYKYGAPPKLSAEAFELARQVYYLQHGSMRDCARAIIAAGLSDTDDVTKVDGRLKNWWKRERWPRRATSSTFAIRDANNDGGLYRSIRICIGAASGHGPAPAGKPCPQSALPDSDYCFHHDPRPEYEEQRRLHAEHLRAGRLATMVPIEPFQRWCDATRRRLLEEERAQRQVHPNATGWGLLATAMGVDLSLLARVRDGKHSRGNAMPMIRASTVVRWAAPLGVAFRDIYGHEPPVTAGGSLTCPQCGGAKNHESKTCRDCYEATLGVQRAYVKRSGEHCSERTAHESGFCHKCRGIVFRVPRPRYKKTSALTPQRLILALSEYRDVPIHAWVAKRMWAANADDIRSAYRHRKSLTAQLVKEFRKRGWNTAEDAERAYRELVDEHGPVPWPTEPDPASVEAAGMVPFAPFLAWLRERKTDVGTYKALGKRLDLDDDRLSQWLRGVGGGAGKQTIRRATVDRALEAWGDDTTFADVYAEGAR